MEEVNDLQCYLDNTQLEIINKLSYLLEDNNIEKKADNIWVLIQQIWEQETGEMLDANNMSDEKVNKIFFDFQTLVAIYVCCRQGHMKIIEGRLILSDPNKAKFSLTPRGIKHVETKLLKKR